MYVHHEVAHQWFADQGHRARATCPLTEIGFVRVVSHPNYPNRPGEVPAAFAILRQLCEAPGHQFWTEEISILDIPEPTAIITHVKLTDVYQAGLAVHKHGKLATLDRDIPIDAIRGGQQAVKIIPS